MSNNETENSELASNAKTELNAEPKNQLKKQSPTLVLTLAGLLATAMVSITYLVTKPAIAKQEQQQLLNIFNEVLPASLADNDIIQTCRLLSSPKLGNNEQHKIYIGKQGFRPSAIIYNTTAPDGYNGDIKLVVAISIAGKVLGVRVLSHSETPGLGDKIEHRKSNWVDNFKGASLETSTWAVNKEGGDFDAFTGATITPRAVIKAMKNVLELHNDKQNTILNMVAKCEVKS